jgi:hypothetical protein
LSSRRTRPDEFEEVAIRDLKSLMVGPESVWPVLSPAAKTSRQFALRDTLLQQYPAEDGPMIRAGWSGIVARVEQHLQMYDSDRRVYAHDDTEAAWRDETRETLYRVPEVTPHADTTSEMAGEAGSGVSGILQQILRRRESASERRPGRPQDAATDPLPRGFERRYQESEGLGEVPFPKTGLVAPDPRVPERTPVRKDCGSRRGAEGRDGGVAREVFPAEPLSGTYQEGHVEWDGGRTLALELQEMRDRVAALELAKGTAERASKELFAQMQAEEADHAYREEELREEHRREAEGWREATRAEAELKRASIARMQQQVETAQNARAALGRDLLSSARGLTSTSGALVLPGAQELIDQRNAQTREHSGASDELVAARAEAAGQSGTVGDEPRTTSGPRKPAPQVETAWGSDRSPYSRWPGQGMSITDMIKLLPMFSGPRSNLSWSDYRISFEMRCEENGVQSGDWAKIIKFKFEGDAAAVIAAIPPKDQLDYDKLVAALD